MDEALQRILKHLRLGGLLAHWDELLAEARRGRFSHERLLKHLLEAEYRGKSEHARSSVASGRTSPKSWRSRRSPSPASRSWTVNGSCRCTTASTI